MHAVKDKHPQPIHPSNVSRKRSISWMRWVNADLKFFDKTDQSCFVEDLDKVEGLVKGLGFQPMSHDDYEPGRRFYFYDSDSVEYEIVSYS